MEFLHKIRNINRESIMAKKKNIKESVFADRFQDFLSKGWGRDVEKSFIQTIAKDKENILSNGEQGKEYLKNLYSKNKSLIVDSCTDEFVQELDRLSSEYKPDDVTASMQPAQDLQTQGNDSSDGEIGGGDIVNDETPDAEPSSEDTNPMDSDRNQSNPKPKSGIGEAIDRNDPALMNVRASKDRAIKDKAEGEKNKLAAKEKAKAIYKKYGKELKEDLPWTIKTMGEDLKDLSSRIKDVEFEIDQAGAGANEEAKQQELGSQLDALQQEKFTISQKLQDFKYYYHYKNGMQEGKNFEKKEMKKINEDFSVPKKIKLKTDVFDYNASVEEVEKDKDKVFSFKKGDTLTWDEVQKVYKKGEKTIAAGLLHPSMYDVTTESPVEKKAEDKSVKNVTMKEAFIADDPSMRMEQIRNRMLSIEKFNMKYNEETNFGQKPNGKEAEIKKALAEWDSLKAERNKLKYGWTVKENVYTNNDEVKHNTAPLAKTKEAEDGAVTETKSWDTNGVGMNETEETKPLSQTKDFNPNIKKTWDVNGGVGGGSSAGTIGEAKKNLKERPDYAATDTSLKIFDKDGFEIKPEELEKIKQLLRKFGVNQRMTTQFPQDEVLIYKFPFVKMLALKKYLQQISKTLDVDATTLQGINNNIASKEPVMQENINENSMFVAPNFIARNIRPKIGSVITFISDGSLSPNGEEIRGKVVGKDTANADFYYVIGNGQKWTVDISEIVDIESPESMSESKAIKIIKEMDRFFSEKGPDKFSGISEEEEIENDDDEIFIKRDLNDNEVSEGDVVSIKKEYGGGEGTVEEINGGFAVVKLEPSGELQSFHISDLELMHTDFEESPFENGQLEYSDLDEDVDFTNANGDPSYTNTGNSNNFLDEANISKKIKLAESKFGRMMGKFHDYVSKVISRLKRAGVSEDSDLDLELILNYYTEGATSRDCAAGYLKAHSVNEAKQITTPKSTKDLDNQVHDKDKDESLETNLQQYADQDDWEEKVKELYKGDSIKFEDELYAIIAYKGDEEVGEFRNGQGKIWHSAFDELEEIEGRDNLHEGVELTPLYDFLHEHIEEATNLSGERLVDAFDYWKSEQEENNLEEAMVVTDDGGLHDYTDATDTDFTECPHCEAHIESDVSECPMCGAQLEDSMEEGIEPGIGNEDGLDGSHIMEDESFGIESNKCENCGHDLIDSTDGKYICKHCGWDSNNANEEGSLFDKWNMDGEDDEDYFADMENRHNQEKAMEDELGNQYMPESIHNFAEDENSDDYWPKRKNLDSAAAMLVGNKYSDEYVEATLYGKYKDSYSTADIKKAILKAKGLTEMSTANMAVPDMPAAFVRRKNELAGIKEFVQKNCDVRKYITEGKFDFNRYINSRPLSFQTTILKEWDDNQEHHDHMNGIEIDGDGIIIGEDSYSLDSFKAFLEKTDPNYENFNYQDTAGNEDYPNGFGTQHNFEEYWNSMPQEEQERFAEAFLNSGEWSKETNQEIAKGRS